MCCSGQCRSRLFPSLVVFDPALHMGLPGNHSKRLHLASRLAKVVSKASHSRPDAPRRRDSEFAVATSQAQEKPPAAVHALARSRAAGSAAVMTTALPPPLRANVYRMQSPCSARAPGWTTESMLICAPVSAAIFLMVAPAGPSRTLQAQLRASGCSQQADRRSLRGRRYHVLQRKHGTMKWLKWSRPKTTK